MRHLFPSLFIVLLCALGSVNIAAESNEASANLARVRFVNYFTGDVYVRMFREGGSAENNIGILNRDETGNPRQTDSLVKTGDSREYIIEPGYYTIILKNDENGTRNAEGNPYGNFYFPPSDEFYEIHLYPSHRRTTRVSVSPVNQLAAWNNLPLNVEFDLVFTQDMIAPLVEQNTSINDENNNPIAVSFIWQGRRRVTVRPKNELTPAVRYTIYVELDARDVEGDRLAEAVVQEFYTARITEVAAVDLATMIFDTMPGTLKMDWELPPNVVGSELKMQDGTITDLQAKTTWTFTDKEARTMPFKIVPYRIINNRKAYSKDAENTPYTTAAELRRKYTDALIEEAMQQGQNFYNQGRYQDAINAYKKAIKIDPDNEDIKRSLKEAEDALEDALGKAEAAKRWRAFLGRFLNYEVYGGSSFTAPWAIIGASNQIYLFPHTFLEAGCDFGFIPGNEYQSDVSYYSIYPYGRFNAYLGTKVRLYAGAGGGWMMARYRDDDEDNRFSMFTFDLAAGLHLNFSRHQGIAASYSLRTPFEPFFQTLNHKVTLGYLIHF
jgi:tetratricopeptide (TPR) repeat protein